MKFSDSTREVIKARARKRCELCGSRVIAGQIHHRQPRGMGGARNDPSKGTAANGLWLHADCHGMVERDRARSLRFGWLILSTDEPEHTPVRLFDGWWLLGVDGSMTKVDRPAKVHAVDAPESRGT